MSKNAKTFNELEQGDQVMILVLAREALNHKNMLKSMSISDEYAEELKNTVDIMTDILQDAN